MSHYCASPLLYLSRSEEVNSEEYRHRCWIISRVRHRCWVLECVHFIFVLRQLYGSETAKEVTRHEHTRQPRTGNRWRWEQCWRHQWPGWGSKVGRCESFRGKWWCCTSSTNLHYSENGLKITVKIFPRASGKIACRSWVWQLVHAFLAVITEKNVLCSGSKQLMSWKPSGGTNGKTHHSTKGSRRSTSPLTRKVSFGKNFICWATPQLVCLVHFFSGLPFYLSLTHAHCSYGYIVNLILVVIFYFTIIV